MVPIAALDPYLSLNLLILANALSVDRDNSVGTVPDAIQRIGSRAVLVLIDRLSAQDFRRIPEDDSAARVLRRASVAAAVAAGRYAERYGVTRERGYTLGLLHTVGYAEMLRDPPRDVVPVGEPSAPWLSRPTGPSWPVVGPRPGACRWTFSPSWRTTARTPVRPAALVRTARATVPGCAIGTVESESVDPLWADEIAREVSVVFEFLKLGPVGSEPPRIRRALRSARSGGRQESGAAMGVLVRMRST